MSSYQLVKIILISNDLICVQKGYTSSKCGSLYKDLELPRVVLLFQFYLDVKRVLYNLETQFFLLLNK